MNNTRNNSNNTNSNKKHRFEAPSWGKLSERQRMEYIQKEIVFIGRKIALPNSDVEHWRRQLTYLLWCPINVWLDADEAKRQGDIKPMIQSKGISRQLMEMAERHIPLDQAGALAQLRQMYKTVTKMLQDYDSRALNNLRVNLGMEPENPQGLELFHRIFGEEEKELTARQTA